MNRAVCAGPFEATGRWPGTAPARPAGAVPGRSYREKTWNSAARPLNKRADGRFRQIKIEVERKGLEVRARKGYFADAPRQPTPSAAAPSSQP